MTADTGTADGGRAAMPAWQALRKMEDVPTHCPVCGADCGTLKFRKRIREGRMSYYLCGSCGVLYANPRATVPTLKNIYASADFFEGSEPGGDHLNYHTFIGGETYLRRTARDRLSRIRRFLPAGRMLEVASAAGFFLKEAKDAGYAVTGVEISVPMARWASEKWGVPITPESVELVELEPAAYDCIASWGVMTIVQDPKAVIRKFHRALKPGGLWAFNTYYHDGLWPRIVGNRWDILVVNFSQLYSRRLIIELAEREGFELVSRRRDWPYTDLMKIADKLAQNLRMTWLPRLLARVGLSELIVRIPLPDVLEYIFRK
jgi:SAM-dependent methyltransferase